MAKRIIWSLQAKAERRQILTYWFHRTGNKNYCRKLASQFRDTTLYISRYNYLGRPTDYGNVRVTVCGDYQIFYRNSESILEIVSVFDSRQNPESLILD